MLGNHLVIFVCNCITSQLLAPELATGVTSGKNIAPTKTLFC